ncbi:MAG: hypothetical protein ACRECD_13020 [Burkholderiaceae bacterium]
MQLSQPLWLVFGPAVLVGCAIQAPTPGMSRDEVVARLGQPTKVIPLGAGERLQYSRQPAGQWAMMVDLDASGKVVQARQVLKAAEFARIEPGKWTRDDVEREFGRPAKIDRVASWNGDVWTYRWTDGHDMFYWVYLDPGGVVRRTQQGMEFLNSPKEKMSAAKGLAGR